MLGGHPPIPPPLKGLMLPGPWWSRFCRGPGDFGAPLVASNPPGKEPRGQIPVTPPPWSIGERSGGRIWGAKRDPPHLLATDGAISEGGISSWLWACRVGGQAGLIPASPRKTWATTCHLGTPRPHPRCPARWVPRCGDPMHGIGVSSPPHPEVPSAGHAMGLIPELAGPGGSLGHGGTPRPPAGAPEGAASAHTPSGSLRVRDEQANPTLIPDYEPREARPKAGCGVAIGPGGPGTDCPPLPTAGSFGVQATHPPSLNLRGSEPPGRAGEQLRWPRFHGWEAPRRWKCLLHRHPLRGGVGGLLLLPPTPPPPPSIRGN